MLCLRGESLEQLTVSAAYYGAPAMPTPIINSTVHTAILMQNYCKKL